MVCLGEAWWAGSATAKPQSASTNLSGSDVFIIQSTSTPVNEILWNADSDRRAETLLPQITAVMPYFGYARQDRKAKARDPISAKLVANLITTAGADRVLTMDPMSRSCKVLISVDHLLGFPPQAFLGEV